MRQLNGVYTQHVNRARHRVGHVFQGCYKSVMVKKETHLLELARYVALNLKRAGMVAEAGQWPSSLYLAFTGCAVVPPWLQTDWVLAHFGAESAGQTAYQRNAAVTQFVHLMRPVWCYPAYGKVCRARFT